MNGQKKGLIPYKSICLPHSFISDFLIYLLTYTTESRPTHSLPKKPIPWLVILPATPPNKKSPLKNKGKSKKNPYLVFDPCALFLPHLFPNVWAHTHKHKPSNHHEILYMQFCTLHTRAHTRKHKPSNHCEDLYT